MFGFQDSPRAGTLPEGRYDFTLPRTGATYLCMYKSGSCLGQSIGLDACPIFALGLKFGENQLDEMLSDSGTRSFSNLESCPQFLNGLPVMVGSILLVQLEKENFYPRAG